jgi:site-specific DNA-cytosine methylase
VKHPAAADIQRKYWSFLLKISPDTPAPTIQAQPGPYVGPFHWENRRLRVGEIKRLFNYPDDFELETDGCGVHEPDSAGGLVGRWLPGWLPSCR